MKILEYDEIEWQQALELNLVGFDWYLTPDLVEKILKADKRVPEGYAIYATEGKTVLGQVGILVDTVQTISGMEKLGYLWTIVTKPGSTNKGIATRLIEEAHSRLISQNVRYSFLGTQKSLVAYNLFKKLGYSDLIDHNMGLKSCSNVPPNSAEHKSTGIRLLREIRTSFDDETIMNMFSKYATGLLGFVHRPQNFLSIRKAWGWMPVNLICVFQKENESVGYLLGTKEDNSIKIRELICVNPLDLSACILAVEKELRPRYIIFDFTSRECVISKLANVGFRFIRPTYATYMIKDLTRERSIEEIRNSFSVKNDKFQMSIIDYY